MCVFQIDEQTQRVLLRWARVRVSTPWGQRISSLEAWDHFQEWNAFVAEMNAPNGPEVKPLLSSALVHMLSFTGVPWLTRGPVIQQAS